MKFTPYFLFISIFLIIASSQTLYAFKDTNEHTFLILGDSLSAGYGIEQGKNWTDLLQHTFDQMPNQSHKINIINASISGDTTANGLERLPNALTHHNIQWILIELGANDGLRGLSIQHIEKNLEKIIKMSLATDAQVFLMQIKIPSNYGKKYTQAFNRIYHKLSKQYDITLLPFMLNKIALNKKFMQADRLHPNEQAQSVIKEYVWKSLKVYIP
ncbi:MAG: arylesterase [Gammaproteobacteria bacterium]|nr:arylesterase [Gammaproteobacteria bacterium]